MVTLNDKPICECKNSGMPATVRAFACECAAKPRARSFLIPVLHRLQTEEGYLKQEHLDELAEIFKIPCTQILGVATFYHFFSLVPRGKHAVGVCTGTACHVKGAGKILTKLEKLLGIKHGETTDDKQFTIQTARCVGMCAMAPVMTIDDKVFGNVTIDEIEEILKEYGYKGDNQ